MGEAAKKVAVITGGGAGIGRASALRFAREGYAVAIGDKSGDDGQSALVAVRAAGAEAVFVHGDVANESDCHALARAAIGAFGRVDVLVANAGARVFGSILDATEADWERILGVNLKGVAYSCKAVLPSMVEQRRGAIVIISSANALLGRADMPLYDATKAAVLSLTRSLAVAHGKDAVRVNAVCPGYTITDFHERKAAARGVSPQELRAQAGRINLLGGPAEPHQLASAVWFLASDDASHITGQTLMVDGGQSVT